MTAGNFEIGVRKYYRFVYPVLFIVILLLVLALAIGLALYLDFKNLIALLIFLCIPLGVGFALVAGVLGYMSLFTWKYRVAFDSTGFSVQTIYHPFFHSYQCPYGEIQKIERGNSAASIRFLDVRGNTFQLPTGWLEGGSDRVLTELERRIPPEKIAPNLRQTVKSRSCRDWAGIVISLSLLFIIYLMLFINLKTEFLFIPIGWNAADWDPLRTDVLTAAIGPDGAPWLVVEPGLRMNFFQLRHAAPDGMKSWDLPSIPYEARLGMSIVEGKDREPWLIFGKQLAQWNGTQWVFIPMPYNADLEHYSNTLLAVKGSEVWGIDQAAKEKRILRLDLGQTPVAAQAIPLPDSVDSQAYSFDGLILAPDNSVIVSITSKTEALFYRYQNDQWLKITSIALDPAKIDCLCDFTLDTGGQIWAAMDPRVRAKPVGIYNPEKNAWIWFDLLHPDFSGTYYGYDSILVDPRNRVWLSGTSSGRGNHAVGVYEIAANNTLVEIRHYTPENSSLQYSFLSSIVLGPDGRIWSWNKQLAWIQSNQQNLPKPLPDGLAFFNSMPGTLILVICLFCLILPLIVTRLALILLSNKKRTV
jgi:hypothetical protein